MTKVNILVSVWVVIALQSYTEAKREKESVLISITEARNCLLLRDAVLRERKVEVRRNNRVEPLRNKRVETRCGAPSREVNGIDTFFWGTQLEITETKVIVHVAKNIRALKPTMPAHIRVASISDPPTNVVSKSANGTTFSGMTFNILKLLSETLAFNYTVSITADNSYGSLSEGKWTGMVRMVKENEADLAVAPFSVTWARAQVVDYTVLYFEEKDVLVIPAPRRSINFLSFVSPFKYQVWLGIVGSIVSVGLATWLSSPAMPLFDFQRALDNMLAAFTLLCCQAGQVIPNSLPTRIVASAWFLAAVILVYTYTSTLISYVTVPVVSPVLESLEDLAYKAPVRLTIWKGTFFDLIIMNATSGPFKALKESFQTSDYTTDLDSSIKKVVSGKYASIGDRTGMAYSIQEDYLKNHQCRITLAKVDIAKGPRSFIVQKNTSWLPLINEKLTKLHEGGLSNYWLSHGGEIMNPCLKIERFQGSANAVSLDDLTSAFCLWGLGIGCAILVAILEIIAFQKRSFH